MLVGCRPNSCADWACCRAHASVRAAPLVALGCVAESCEAGLRQIVRGGETPPRRVEKLDHATCSRCVGMLCVEQSVRQRAIATLDAGVLSYGLAAWMHGVCTPGRCDRSRIGVAIDALALSDRRCLRRASGRHAPRLRLQHIILSPPPPSPATSMHRHSRVLFCGLHRLWKSVGGGGGGGGSADGAVGGVRELLGEWAMIEPTREFGYLYFRIFVIARDARRKEVGASVGCTKDAMRLPDVRWRIGTRR